MLWRATGADPVGPARAAKASWPAFHHQESESVRNDDAGSLPPIVCDVRRVRRETAGPEELPDVESPDISEKARPMRDSGAKMIKF